MESIMTTASPEPAGDPEATWTGTLAVLASVLEDAGARLSAVGELMRVGPAAGLAQQQGVGAGAILAGMGASGALSAPEGGSDRQSDMATQESAENAGESAGVGGIFGAKAVAAQEAAKSIQDVWKETLDYMDNVENASAKGTADAWLARTQAATRGSKKLQAIHRAAAVAQAIRNTALGITATFKGPPDGPPFPANIAMAAMVAARGASELATIKGQAHDGLDRVPSTGTYLLERGERVVDKRLNRDLSLYLAGQRGNVVNQREQTIHHSPSVNLTINGDPDPDTVRSNRGTLETMIRDIYADHALANPFD